MLSIPVKKSEQQRLSKSLEVFVSKNYDSATLDKVRPFFSSIDECRRAFVDSGEGNTIEGAIAAGESYLAAIKILEQKVQISSTDLKFQWLETYTKAKHPVLNYTLEKACIMYSLASLHSKIASDIDLRGTNAHKIALNSLQLAAGWLGSCKDLLRDLNSDNKLDVGPENVQMWSDIMIAQAYMTMYDKLDKQTANKVNVAKVAYSVHRNFEQAAVCLPQVKNFPKESENLLRYYSAVFHASAHYYMALAEKEKSIKTSVGFGKVVARLKLSETLITKAMQFKGIKNAQFELGRNLLNLITSEKTTSEGENFSIYMDRVPEENALDSIEILSMVTAKASEPRSCPNEDLMNSIVPLEVVNLHKDYCDYTWQVFNVFKIKVQAAIQQISSLQSGGGSVMPEALWSEIAAVQAKDIERNISSIKGNRKAARDMMEKIKNQLLKEESDEEAMKKQYGSKWNREPSSLGNSEIKSKIETLLKKCQQAEESDNKTENDFLSKKSIINKILLPRDQLENQLPNIDVSLQAEQGVIYNTMKNSINTLENSLSKYSESISKNDASEGLIKLRESGSSKEQIFSELNEKFSSLREEIDNELESLAEKREELQKLQAAGSVESRAGSLLNEWRTALEMKKVIDKRLDDGLTFYSKLLDNVVSLDSESQGFIKAREFGKQDLLKIVGAKPAEPTKAPVSDSKTRTLPTAQVPVVQPPPQYPSQFTNQPYPPQYAQNYAPPPAQPGYPPAQPGYPPNYAQFPPPPAYGQYPPPPNYAQYNQAFPPQYPQGYPPYPPQGGYQYQPPPGAPQNIPYQFNRK